MEKPDGTFQQGFKVASRPELPPAACMAQTAVLHFIPSTDSYLLGHLALLRALINYDQGFSTPAIDGTVGTSAATTRHQGWRHKTYFAFYRCACVRFLDADTGLPSDGMASGTGLYPPPFRFPTQPRPRLRHVLVPKPPKPCLVTALLLATLSQRSAPLTL